MRKHFKIASTTGKFGCHESLETDPSVLNDSFFFYLWNAMLHLHLQYKILI